MLTALAVLFAIVQTSHGQILPLGMEEYDFDQASKILKSDASFFKYMMNNEFSRLVTGNSFTGIGQYATISTENDNLSAALNFITNSGVFDLEIKGGSSEGITTLINQTSLNTSIGAELAYHINLSKKGQEDFITIEIDDLRRIEDTEENLKQEYRIEAFKLNSKEASLLSELKKNEQKLKEKNQEKLLTEDEVGFKRNLLLTELELLQEKREYYSGRDNIQNELRKLRAKRDKIGNTDVFKAKTFLLDSIKLFGLRKEIEAQIAGKNLELASFESFSTANNQILIDKEIDLIEEEISSIKKKIDFHKRYANRLKNQLRNDYVEKIKENRKKVFDIKAADVQLTWLTLGVGGNNNSYDFFDSSRPLQDQFFKNEDLTWSFMFAYSSYKNVSGKALGIGNRNVRFKSFGIKGNIANNINDIGKIEVVTIEELSTTREVLERKEAFQGSFEDNIFTGLIFYDAYRFVGNKDNVGLHFRSTFQFGEIRPVSSLRFGVVLPFQSIEKKGSFLNLELFAGLNDIFNSNGEESIFDRNIIGVQATVPFNFKIL